MNTPLPPAPARKHAALSRKHAALFRETCSTFPKKCLRLWPLALLLLLAAACSSRKHTLAGHEEAPVLSPATEGQTGEALARQSISWQGSYTAKARFNLTLGEKNLSLGGTLRLQRDRALQLSLQVPLLGTEAVRIEASPEQILIIDRIHKSYVEEPIARLSALSGTGLDFYALQALLSATLFRPGQPAFTLADAAAMQQSPRQAQNIVRLSTSASGLSCAFDLDAASLRLAATSLAKTGSPYATTWQYGGYENTASRAFPTHIKAQFTGAAKPLALELSLSSLQPAEWTPGSRPSGRYRKIPLDAVLRLLSTL